MKAFTNLILLLLLLSCAEKEQSFVFNYFPEDPYFERGVVNKYYQHYLPNESNQHSATDIYYELHKKLGPDRYAFFTYNAGMQLSAYMELVAENGKTFVDTAYSINWADTIAANYTQPFFQDWNGMNDQKSVYTKTYDDVEYRYERSQVSVGDTMVMDRPGKIFVMSRTIISEEGDTVVQDRKSNWVYVQGFGLFSTQTFLEGRRYESELVEQMSVKEFRKRADHGRHRVAYIDPDITLDDSKDFELCGHELNIADYYNSDPDGRYIDGKRAMMDIIDSKLDATKLFNAAGYLTFRFVVNCQGKAGRFTTEFADLDFQDTTFPDETVRHLYDVLSSLEEWRPVVNEDEPRDAYFYITFKLKDGEITDILP